MLSTAQKYLYEQNYEQAILGYEPIINLDPKNVDAYLGLAQAYTGIGDKEKTVETLEKGFEMTGDERIKEILDKLLENKESEESSETTIETAEELTITNVESDNSANEATSTFETEETAAVSEEKISVSEEATDNIEEEIRARAISVIEMFDVYKSTAEPNSVIYYYLPNNSEEDIAYPLTKCVYDENGTLLQTYETSYFVNNGRKFCSDEVISHNWKEHSTEFYGFYGTYTQSDMSDYKKICYKKCFLDTDYIMTTNAHTGLAYSNFKGVSENCYSFENPYNSEIIKIYVDNNNDIIDITVESDWSDARFYLENNNWISNFSTSWGYSSKFYPCENKLPDGASDEDFLIPTVESESCKTFYNSEEYYNYHPDIF